MHEAAAGRLTVMAGGGVDVGDFALFRDAGLNDVHLSAKRPINVAPPSPMTAATLMEEPSYFLTDPDLVNQAGRAALAFS